MRARGSDRTSASDLRVSSRLREERAREGERVERERVRAAVSRAVERETPDSLLFCGSTCHPHTALQSDFLDNRYANDPLTLL